MRDPDNIIQVPINNSEYTVLSIGELPEFDIQDYDLFDDKQFKRFMSDLERMIRTSFEYQTLVQYIRENMEMNSCAFYENVNNIETSKIKIHIHHDPLSLYDICLVVFNKRVAYQELLNIEMVAKEVMFLHYKLFFGLIPLSETVHELVHNNYLFVPTDKVLGNYREFVNLYKPFFPPEQLDILERIEALTYTVALNTDILKKSFVYIDDSGNYNFPSFEDIKAIINSTEEQVSKTDNCVSVYDNNKMIVPATIVKKEE